RKPNDKPLYIHKNSNHPPNIIRELPNTINKRLNTISSNQAEFDKAKPIYQRTLAECGYDHNLVYEEQTPAEPQQTKKKKNRKRQIIWYNPPFNSAVTTNIGRRFLSLIDKHFPKENKLHKIINRNTVKISYSCTKNIKSIIQSHNQKLLSQSAEPTKTNPQHCNCRDKSKCPLDNHCLQGPVVYQATVLQGEPKQYIGSTEDFKKRYATHKNTFKDDSKKNSTCLLHYIWSKNLNPNPELKWSVLGKAQAYRPGNRFCDLCLTEKLHIANNANNPMCLNKRWELLLGCRHVTRHRLSALHKKETKNASKQEAGSTSQWSGGP
ncbi:MAG: hypothetical protein MJA29_07015, partial [Candidatus Omnitrophica bacterium]|nr:hypothetical protein [Candidatus Omnitrophota bacterium]